MGSSPAVNLIKACKLLLRVVYRSYFQVMHDSRDIIYDHRTVYGRRKMFKSSNPSSGNWMDNFYINLL